MLPITSPFDTYRAGLWAVQQNIRLFTGYIVLMAATNLLISAIDTEGVFLGLLLMSAIDTEGVFLGLGAAAALLLSLVLLIGACMIQALLIYPLHATFLSDGRTKGLAAIESLGQFLRIGWRLFVIFVLALIPSLILLVPAMLFAVQGTVETDPMVAASGPGDAAATADLYEVAVLGVMTLFFGISVILFGPHIPDIVTKNDTKPGPSSFQRGTRHFWRMAANLAAGPGLVVLAYEVPRWLIVAGPAEGMARNSFKATALLSDFIGVCVTAFCAAMTAGVLSDAYRRALATEAESIAA